MAFAFEKLIVYQKAIDFADQVCQLTEQFPRGYGFLVDQLNRASLSIAANIAEGNGRFTKPDRKNFFGIARGSVQECVPLLELARRRRLFNDAVHAEMEERLEGSSVKILAQFTAFFILMGEFLHEFWMEFCLRGLGAWSWHTRRVPVRSRTRSRGLPVPTLTAGTSIALGPAISPSRTGSVRTAPSAGCIAPVAESGSASGKEHSCRIPSSHKTRWCGSSSAWCTAARWPRRPTSARWTREPSNGTWSTPESERTTSTSSGSSRWNRHSRRWNSMNCTPGWLVLLEKKGAPAKTRHVKRRRREMGRNWVHAAIASASRFVIDLRLGPRTKEVAVELVGTVALCGPDASRPPPLFLVDDHLPYPAAILQVWGQRQHRRRRTGRGRRKLPRLKPPPRLLAGVVKKVRDGGGNLVRVRRRALFGSKQAVVTRIQELGIGQTIHTAHVERLNGTLRGQQARLARRTQTLSRRRRWLQWSLWLWRDWYNWVHPHRSLGGQTPAMAQGLTDHAWSVRDSMQIPVHVDDLQRAWWAEAKQNTITSALIDQKHRQLMPTS